MSSAYNELFFVRGRNPQMERWTGKRLGAEEVKEQLGISNAFNNSEFKNIPVDFSSFSLVIYDNLPDDLGSDANSLLIRTFMDKAGIKQVDCKDVVQIYTAISEYATPENIPQVAGYLKNALTQSDNNEFKTNPIILEIINHPDSSTLASVKEKIRMRVLPAMEYNRLISSLREIKTPEELALLKKSAFISAIAHREVMKAIQPEFSENEIAGIFEYIHRKYGAEEEGYPPIVASGANGCILHYSENKAPHVMNQLVLMDVASEYHGYSADIVRTVPGNGIFSPEQKAIYQIVYDTQEEVFKLCKEGTPLGNLDEKAREVIAAGLIKLGIIKNPQEVMRYYSHGVSHPIGLDVHDKSISDSLKANMVITVEPGIYIPEGSPCDPKWWTIAVRIEDDVIIGENDCEIISTAAPRKAEEVEKMAAQKSALNDLVLPEYK